MVIAVEPPLKSNNGTVDDITLTVEDDTSTELLAESSPRGNLAAETVIRADPDVVNRYSPMNELYRTLVDVATEL